MKNVLRQRTRTVLAILGISLGITTVVALGVITNGLRTTAGEVIRAGGADFMIGQKGAADLTFSTIHEDEVRQLAARPDVDRAVGVLIIVKSVGSNPFFSMAGVDPAELSTIDLDIREGRRFGPDAGDEIMLGDAAAKDLDVVSGENVTLDHQTFRVVGIYHTGNLWQDKGAYVPLRTLQAQSGRADVVTVVYVWIKPGLDRKEVSADIGNDHPGLAPILSEADYGEIDQGMDMINSANFAISLLAVGIGAIGVMNTMVMAVVER
ncbi:MAG: ABC transporter permease, partial [Chloroflexota bacterium]|nr:ABC transporter permease [Chloroflexota bacterium]